MKGSKTINMQLAEYAAIEQSIKENQAKKAELEKKILAYGDQHAAKFVNNELALDAGTIKLVNNPATIVTEDGKALGRLDKASFIDGLSKDFKKETINWVIKNIKDALPTNAALRRYMANKGVKLASTTKMVIQVNS